jgi:hypothetical protein
MIGGLAFAAGGCGDDVAPLTQVMVVVNSDVAGIDAVRVRVEGMGETKHAVADDLTEQPLPRSVAVVHEGGPLGPIQVIAEAMAGEAMLVSRQAELSFVRGRNLMLHLELMRSCLESETLCSDSDETCIDGTCEPIEVDASELPEWSGSPPAPRDAGSDAEGGASNPEAGVDDAGDASADGEVEDASPDADSGGGSSECDTCVFDPTTAEPHATLSCTETTSCSLSCDANYVDLDQQRGNGCEVRAGSFTWSPSNVDPTAAAIAPAIVESLVLDCSATLDFGSAELPATVDLCGQAVQPVLMAQSNAGSDVVVLATRQLTTTPASVLRFTGARPVVLLVYGDASVEGELDVSAQGTAPGAGSQLGCELGTGTAGQSSIMSSSAGGGGGGGFASMGGAGGIGDENKVGGAGGMPSADALLSPLRGGCAGGAGGQSYGSPSAGGAGGGALQLSVSGLLRVTGALAAAGGGGNGTSD